MSFISNESVLSLSDKANNKSTDDLDTKSIETGQSEVWSQAGFTFQLILNSLYIFTCRKDITHLFALFLTLN